MVCPVGSGVKPSGAWVVLALGSNLGEREEHLAFARSALADRGFAWSLASSILETAACGGPEGQGHYLNQVLAASRESVEHDPRALLDLCLQIEKERGRVRRERWGARVLDLDIIFFGEELIREVGLRIPHRERMRRLFVLEPLAEILPDYEDPEAGKTVRRLLAECRGLL